MVASNCHKWLLKNIKIEFLVNFSDEYLNKIKDKIDKIKEISEYKYFKYKNYLFKRKDIKELLEDLKTLKNINIQYFDIQYDIVVK